MYPNYVFSNLGNFNLGSFMSALDDFNLGSFNSTCLGIDIFLKLQFQ